MNKIGFAYLNGGVNGKKNKNLKGVNNTLADVLGKSLIKNDKKLNFSKLMEESLQKTETESKKTEKTLSDINLNKTVIKSDDVKTEKSNDLTENINLNIEKNNLFSSKILQEKVLEQDSKEGSEVKAETVKNKLELTEEKRVKKEIAGSEPENSLETKAMGNLYSQEYNSSVVFREMRVDESKNSLANSELNREENSNALKITDSKENLNLSAKLSTLKVNQNEKQAEEKVINGNMTLKADETLQILKPDGRALEEKDNSYSGRVEINTKTKDVFQNTTSEVKSEAKETVFLSESKKTEDNRFTEPTVNADKLTLSENKNSVMVKSEKTDNGKELYILKDDTADNVSPKTEVKISGVNEKSVLEANKVNIGVKTEIIVENNLNINAEKNSIGIEDKSLFSEQSIVDGKQLKNEYVNEKNEKTKNIFNSERNGTLQEEKFKVENNSDEVIAVKSSETDKIVLNKKVDESGNGLNVKADNKVNKSEEKQNKTENIEIKKETAIELKQEDIKTDINSEKNYVAETKSEEKVEKNSNNHVVAEKSEDKKSYTDNKSSIKNSENSVNLFAVESSINEMKSRIEIKDVQTQMQSKLSGDNIYGQVENMIKMSFNADTKEMKLRLSPDDLGEVEVKINIENSIMRAEFLVENEKVKETLESRFNELKNALLEKGITASEINVNISNGDSQERGYAQKAFYEGLMENSGTKRENIKVNREYVAAVERNSAGYNRNLNGTLDILS